MTSRFRQTGWLARGRYLDSVRGTLAVVLFVMLGFADALAQTAEPYQLKPGDVVSITVLEDPLLDRQVLVAPDGRIAMPLAGSIVAARQTPEKLAGIVQARLRSRFVDPPTVTVSLVTIPDKEDDKALSAVFVLGEVNKPGRYEYDVEKPITVLEALTLAGGTNAFAATGRIQVRERIKEAPVLRLFDYEAILDGAVPTVRDLAALSDGAIIVVPERGLFE